MIIDENLSDSLKAMNITKETTNSYSNLNNWLFGISVGLFVTIYFKSDRIQLETLPCLKFYFIIMVVLAMLNCLVLGIIKYRFHVREIKLNEIEVELHKFVLSSKLQNLPLEETKPIFTEKIGNWFTVHNTIVPIAKCLNYGIPFTTFNVIIVGIFLILIII